MLPGQCGDCRGLKSVEEQATADAAALRAWLLSGADGRNWWEAKYAGHCSGCQQWYVKHTAIRRDAQGTGFIAECCAEGDGDEH